MRRNACIDNSLSQYQPEERMRLLFFAQLKDAIGHSELEWSTAGAMSAEELWQRLLREFPALARHRPSVRLARNGVYAGADTVFEPADEVALIPPVSGG
jgi:molybdopterin converting factor subunit 1